MGARRPPDGAEIIRELLADMNDEDGTQWAVKALFNGEVLLQETGSDYAPFPAVPPGVEQQRVSKSFSGFDSQQLHDGRWVSFAVATVTTINAPDGPAGHAYAVGQITDRVFCQTNYISSDGTPTNLFEYLWGWAQARIDAERNRTPSR